MTKLPRPASPRELIVYWSRYYKVDPRAALSVARHEGGVQWGGRGDGGTSYGPFQLHVGGALPPGKSEAWANSEAGIKYAIRQMARSGAAGKKGYAAIVAIVRNFERPANPGAEIQRAWGTYRTLGAPKATGGKNLKAVKLAKGYLGTPYVWGGSAPGGFDCSGLVQYVYGKLGVNLPRTTYDQWKTGRKVPKGQLKPGDIVFFNAGPRGPEHEGMYIGNGKFIEAPHRGANVRISTLADRSDYMGARRVVKSLPSQGVVLASRLQGSPALDQGQQQEYVFKPRAGGAAIVNQRMPRQEGYQKPNPYETWQMIASVPNASPETQSFARRASNFMEDSVA